MSTPLPLPIPIPIISMKGHGGCACKTREITQASYAWLLPFFADFCIHIQLVTHVLSGFVPGLGNDSLRERAVQSVKDIFRSCILSISNRVPPPPPQLFLVCLFHLEDTPGMTTAAREWGWVTGRWTTLQAASTGCRYVCVMAFIWCVFMFFSFLSWSLPSSFVADTHMYTCIKIYSYIGTQYTHICTHTYVHNIT